MGSLTSKFMRFGGIRGLICWDSEGVLVLSVNFKIWRDLRSYLFRFMRGS